MVEGGLKLVSIYPPGVDTKRGYRTSIRITNNSKYIIHPRGKLVIIRKTENLSSCMLYEGHSQTVKAVGICRNTQQIASGDSSGEVRIWELNEETEVILEQKNGNYFPGGITDIIWTTDGSKLIISGVSKEKYLTCVLFSTMGQQGDMGYHSRVVNSVAVSPNRPFIVAAGSEDTYLSFYNGIPFKLLSVLKEHTNFVNALEFSPSGSKLISVSMDKRILRLSGMGELEGEVKDSVEENNHTKGIMSIEFLSENRIMTCSNDCTIKIWDLETNSVIQTFDRSELGNDIDNMQVACVSHNKGLISVNLDGSLNQWKFNLKNIPFETTPQQEIEIIGHRAAISGIQKVNESIYTADSKGLLVKWENYMGKKINLSGMNTESGIQSIETNCTKSDLFVCLVEGGVFQIQLSSLVPEHMGKFDGCSLDLSPSQIDPNICYILFNDNSIGRFNSCKLEWREMLPNTLKDLTCLCAADHKGFVFVGTKKGAILILDVATDPLKPPILLSPLLNMEFAITSIKLSSNKELIAATDVFKYLTLWNIEDKKVVGDPFGHTSKVSHCSWDTEGKRAITCCSDNHVYIWDLIEHSRTILKNPHIGGATQTIFLSENTFLTAGSDSLIKQWAL